jgi:O-acetylhomoserine/O-acetylserine sulfhydrylase-like pyridoxal-dependent enzyme
MILFTGLGVAATAAIGVGTYLLLNPTKRIVQQRVADFETGVMK